MTDIECLLLLGTAVGAVLGLTGAGGAIIAVPLLVFGLHLSTAQAAPMALLAVATASLTGAFIGLYKHQVRYRAASLIAFSGALAAPIGVWGAGHIPNQPLTILFALTLLYVATRLWTQPAQNEAELSLSDLDLLPCQVPNFEEKIRWNMQCVRALTYTGALTGLLSGLLGVGGGFVVIPALKKYSNIRMPHILPTSLSVIALISSAGVLSAFSLGKLHFDNAIPFALGALLGMLASIKLRSYCSPSVLQRGFAGFAMVVAMGLLAKALIT